MSPPTFTCRNPLRDGSPCHSCRIFSALTDAEKVLDPHAVADGILHTERCVTALGEVLTHFLVNADDQDAMEFVADLFLSSRHQRRQQDDDDDDPLANPVGHA